MKMHPFVQAVASLKFANCFNPYSDKCEIYDRPDAACLRAAILSALVNSAASKPVDAIWIGRDLGYRGGRRTGLALTDDVHATEHAERWNISMKLGRPTVGIPVSEKTAAIIWELLAGIDERIFLWNVFPLHPHSPGMPFTNRLHNAQEKKVGEILLQQLIVLLRPKRIIAIGNDAAASASRVSGAVPVIHVRHPSYGGQSQFREQIIAVYGRPANAKSLFD